MLNAKGAITSQHLRFLLSTSFNEKFTPLFIILYDRIMVSSVYVFILQGVLSETYKYFKHVI